jgi:DNA-binding transcriptional ArsR family regulator
MCYQLTVDVFTALADPVRRDLLVRLAVGGPTRVVDLAADHPISRPAVSRHLRVLTDAGLATAEDRGRERLYALRGEGLAPVHGLLRVLAVAQPRVGTDALDALDLEVRRTVRDHRSPSPTQQTSWEEIG